MIALVRYLVADTLLTQRWLAPLIAYLAVLAVMYAGDPGSPLPAYAGTAAVLFPVVAWLTVVVVNSEDPVLRSVTTAAAGGWGRVLSGLLGAVLTMDGVLVLLATVTPIVFRPQHYGLMTVAAGMAGHAICAVAGTAVGLVCARPVVPRAGWSICAVLGLLLLMLALRRASPVGATITALAAERPQGLAFALAGSAVLSMVMLAGATATCYMIGRSRI